MKNQQATKLKSCLADEPSRNSGRHYDDLVHQPAWMLPPTQAWRGTCMDYHFDVTLYTKEARKNFSLKSCSK